jgi:hypothetical protein
MRMGNEAWGLEPAKFYILRHFAASGGGPFNLPLPRLEYITGNRLGTWALALIENGGMQDWTVFWGS